MGDGRTSSDRLECSASHLKRRQPRHDIVLIVYLPRRAINIDVLPEPVGPTMRLIRPFLKSSSPLIRSLNGRVPLPGVEGISVSFNHVKHASLKPMASALGMGLERDVGESAESAGPENSSSSSVCRLGVRS